MKLKTDVKRVACRLSRPSSRFAFGERNAPNGGCGGLARLRAARARGRALLKPLRSDLKARGVRFCAGTSALKRGGTRPLHRLGTQSERERPDRHRTTRLSPNSRPGAPPSSLHPLQSTANDHFALVSRRTNDHFTDHFTDHRPMHRPHRFLAGDLSGAPRVQARPPPSPRAFGARDGAPIALAHVVAQVGPVPLIARARGGGGAREALVGVRVLGGGSAAQMVTLRHHTRHLPSGGTQT